MARYDSEREGRLAFYRAFLPVVDSGIKADDVPDDYNDGVLNGNLLEFKLHVSDLNAHLFQCVKYLSARRVKGKPVPKNIFVIDLSDGVAFRYDSSDYLEHIEKTYYGPASKNNEGFLVGPPSEKLEFEASETDASKLVKLLRKDEYTKTHIDENCIVGWAEEYYRQRPGARKEHFIGDSTGKHKVTGEIRQPKLFADYIYPYEGETNVRFDYLMDCLNDFIQKKDLGAFFTPEPYAEKARELLLQAIERVPDGNDYVVIDRCAGTGNLERGLSDEVLGHCVVSTKEYYEYKVLQEVIGDKVREMIPPVEAESTFDAGNVRGADALSEGYVKNEIVRKYVDDPNCTIILFENPPFAETTSMEHQKRGAGRSSSKGWKGSWVLQRLKETIAERGDIPGTAANDMGNAFIWSAFEYYLRQPTDSYVVFSPIKYWKAQSLVNKKVLGGFCGDRHHFHARKHSCVTVILWSNEDADPEPFRLPAWDIGKEGLVETGTLLFERVRTSYSERYFDKRPFAECESGILCGLNGLEKIGAKQSQQPVFAKDVIGYMAVYAYGFENPETHSSLLIAGRYDGHGFYLRRDNYIEKLPMFAASRYISYANSWTERGRVMKSADGAERFKADVRGGKLEQYLLKVLLFTCLEYQNHMRSLHGSDGRFYRNELCLDDSNGDTVATVDLRKLVPGEAETRLMNAWSRVIEEARKTRGYDGDLSYGPYQIGEELDSYVKTEDGGRIYEYPELHGAVKALKKLCKDYYLKELVPTLFEYEFLK